MGKGLSHRLSKLRTILVIALAYAFAFNGLGAAHAKALAPMDSFGVLCSVSADASASAETSGKGLIHSHDCVACVTHVSAASAQVVAVVLSMLVAYEAPARLSLAGLYADKTAPPLFGLPSSKTSRAPPAFL